VADPAKVTAGVTRTALLSSTQPDGLRADRFYYPAGGHTHWHLHTGEQVLYGEQGDGWVKFADRPRIALSGGTIVHVRVGIPHWHGATPDGPLVHLAVTAGGDTTWLGEVSPEEYAAD
jgi:quercetin dioxygenase-like cupin family protein